MKRHFLAFAAQLGVFLLLNSLCLAALPDLASSSANLPNSTQPANAYQLSSEQTITAQNVFQNIGSGDATTPFFVGWFLSPYPVGFGCNSSRLNPSPLDSNAKLLANNYVSGLAAGAIFIPYIENVPLPSSLPSGQYCLWSFVNYLSFLYPQYRNSVAEVDLNSAFNNNAYVFSRPICIGPRCNSLSKITVYPNPVIGNTAELRLPDDFINTSGSSSVVILYTLDGRRVSQQALPEGTFDNRLQLDTGGLNARTDYEVVFYNAQTQTRSSTLLMKR